MDDLWALERDFWLKGADHVADHLAQECLMVLPSVGILDRDQALASLAGAPRWTGIEMLAGREAVVGDAVTVLAYEAAGHRDDMSYRAHCTSTYQLDKHHRWKMVQHQQTPTA